MEQQQKRRPTGVTILAILTIIDGIAFFASGIAAVTVAPVLFGVDINNNNLPPVTGTSTLGSITIPDTLLVGMMVVTGVAILTLSIAYFVVAYGLFKGKGWAWIVTVVLSMHSYSIISIDHMLSHFSVRLRQRQQ